MNGLTWAGDPSTRWPARDALGPKLPPNGLSHQESIDVGYITVTDARDGMEIWALPNQLVPYTVQTAAQVPTERDEITDLQVRVAKLEAEIVNLRAKA